MTNTLLETALRSLPPGLEAHRRRCALLGASFRPAAEDWSPNFPGELVAIAIIEDSDGRARVVIRGADDTGMECTVPSREAAWRLYKSLPAVIWTADLATRGFVGS